MPSDGGQAAMAALAGAAGGVLASAAALTFVLRSQRVAASTEPAAATSGGSASSASRPDGGPTRGDSADNVNRSKSSGIIARWTKPVVIASPGLEDLAIQVRKRLGCDEYSEAEGPIVSTERFKSGDPNMRFNWQRVVGRKIVFLFDTVDQARIIEQLSLLQALQGFAVPDGEDHGAKWKTYVDRGKYSWGRASHITVVLPWYRPCQMERTSRWAFKDGKWTNSDPKGQYLDVPSAQYLARLLSTPGSVPPLPGPSTSIDGMPLNPLWRPPLELLFVELHEEIPVSHAASDLGVTMRMERFVPYFLDRYKAQSDYPGAGSTYVLFPDFGAYKRNSEASFQRLKLDHDHVLYIEKTRVGDEIGQVQKLFYDTGQGEIGEKAAFLPTDSVLIIDDFTNSGSTLFGAVEIVRKLVKSGGAPTVSIFVSHLVALYDPKVVESLRTKLHSMGPSCRFYTTNTIPCTTDILKGDPQVEVIDISDFIADMVL